ncbi:MAG: IS4 family transposase [Euryarchaeota archaeon]|nr:IS4 family transposase [Euryarchaeota archaeon]
MSEFIHALQTGSRFPATRSRKVAAGIKVAFLFSVVCNSPKTLTFFPERTNDAKTLKIGSWVKDNLLLIDRGFFRHETFSLIGKYDGSFISRVKTTSKPKIKEFNVDIPEHMCEQCIGLDIYKTMEILKGKNIDATVKLQYRSKNSKGKYCFTPFELRFIARYNPDTQEYHTYLTNLSQEFPADAVADLYTLRWDIELIFRELKSEYLTGRLVTTNDSVMETFLRIPMLTLMVSRRLFATLKKMIAVAEVERYRNTKWCRVFAENARRILRTYIKEKNGSAKEDAWGDILTDLIEGTRSTHANRHYLTKGKYF